MSRTPFLFGPFSQPVTPHLNKNQSFEDTERHQQHDHPLLVYHVLFPSNFAARQTGDRNLFSAPALLSAATVSASYHVSLEICLRSVFADVLSVMRQKPQMK